MTIKHAEYLTGYEIEVDRKPKGVTATVTLLDGAVAFFIEKRQKDALRALVYYVERIHKQFALKRDDWKCADCQSLGPLQVHHVVFKSHGGTNRVENMRSQCGRCHAAKHGIKVI